MHIKKLPQDFLPREEGAILVILELFLGESGNFISHCAIIKILYTLLRT